MSRDKRKPASMCVASVQAATLVSHWSISSKPGMPTIAQVMMWHEEAALSQKRDAAPLRLLTWLTFGLPGHLVVCLNCLWSILPRIVCPRWSSSMGCCKNDSDSASPSLHRSKSEIFLFKRFANGMNSGNPPVCCCFLQVSSESIHLPQGVAFSDVTVQCECQEHFAHISSTDDSVRELQGGHHFLDHLIPVQECENHVRELRTFFTVVLEPNIHTFSVLSETLPDFFKSKHGATQSKPEPKLVLFKANTVAVYSLQKQTKQRNTRSALPNSIIKEIYTY